MSRRSLSLKQKGRGIGKRKQVRRRGGERDASDVTPLLEVAMVCSNYVYRCS